MLEKWGGGGEAWIIIGRDVLEAQPHQEEGLANFLKSQQDTYEYNKNDYIFTISKTDNNDIYKFTRKDKTFTYISLNKIKLFMFLNKLAREAKIGALAAKSENLLPEQLKEQILQLTEQIKKLTLEIESIDPNNNSIVTKNKLFSKQRKLTSLETNLNTLETELTSSLLL